MYADAPEPEPPVPPAEALEDEAGFEEEGAEEEASETEALELSASEELLEDMAGADELCGTLGTDTGTLLFRQPASAKVLSEMSNAAHAVRLKSLSILRIIHSIPPLCTGN